MGKSVNFDDLGYPAGTVATATVAGVENVRVLRRLTSAGYDWAFNPEPNLGLNYSCIHDNKNLVTDIVVIDNEPPKAQRVAPDLSTISGRDIDNLVIAILGDNERDDGDYYNDYTGANAFWHLLAGTQNTSNYGNINQVPDRIKINANGSITVDGIGDFVKIEVDSTYNEMGDLDYWMVYRLGNRFFKKEAGLDSWSGGLWDGMSTEVKKVTKTVEVWQ